MSSMNPIPEQIKPSADIPAERNVPAKQKQMSSNRRMFYIFAKTWTDCFKPKKVITVIIFMVIVPLLASSFGSTVDYSSISIQAGAANFSFALLPYFYMSTLGIVLCAVIGGQGAGMIANEIEKGTMLILVSKPVSRFQIYLGKFLAVYAFGALISFLGITATCWILVLIKSGTIYHFIALFPFIWLMTLYSLFVEAIFLSISMALSSILATGKKVTILMLVMVILTFLVFMMVRTFMMFSPVNYYEVYYLYMIDLGYHLGNVLILFNSVTGIVPPSQGWQYIFDMLAGTFASSTLDPSQSIDLGSYPLVGYVQPWISLVIWIGVAFLLTAYGLFKLKKKEITS